jgi:hypothetical protein
MPSGGNDISSSAARRRGIEEPARDRAADDAPDREVASERRTATRECPDVGAKDLIDLQLRPDLRELKRRFGEPSGMGRQDGPLIAPADAPATIANGDAWPRSTGISATRLRTPTW